MEVLLRASDVRIICNGENIYYQAGLKYFGSRSVLVGMSPGNGYFTEENMESIIAGLCEVVPRVYVLIPDSPHLYNFLGMGYPIDDARKKSRKDISQTRNRLNRAASRLVHDLGISNFRVVDWDGEIVANNLYQKSLEIVMNEYEVNKKFNDVVNRVAREYLMARSRDRTVIDMDVKQGAIYYLSELALFVYQDEIFGEQISVAYYKKWGDGLDFLMDLFPGFAERFSMIQYGVDNNES